MNVRALPSRRTVVTLSPSHVRSSMRRRFLELATLLAVTIALLSTSAGRRAPIQTTAGAAVVHRSQCLTSYPWGWNLARAQGLLENRYALNGYDDIVLPPNPTWPETGGQDDGR